MHVPHTKVLKQLIISVRVSLCHCSQISYQKPQFYAHLISVFMINCSSLFINSTIIESDRSFLLFLSNQRRVFFLQKNAWSKRILSIDWFMQLHASTFNQFKNFRKRQLKFNAFQLFHSEKSVFGFVCIIPSFMVQAQNVNFKNASHALITINNHFSNL